MYIQYILNDSYLGTKKPNGFLTLLSSSLAQQKIITPRDLQNKNKYGFEEKHCNHEREDLLLGKNVDRPDEPGTITT